MLSIWAILKKNSDISDRFSKDMSTPCLFSQEYRKKHKDARRKLKPSLKSWGLWDLKSVFQFAQTVQLAPAAGSWWIISTFWGYFVSQAGFIIQCEGGQVAAEDRDLQWKFEIIRVSALFFLFYEIPTDIL